MLFKEVKNLLSGSILIIDLKTAKTREIPYTEIKDIDTWDDMMVYSINGSMNGDIHVCVK